jgi:lysophospholipase L1-like esterase
MMKGTIICYGDSNTYGYDPRLGGEGRFPEEVRWTGILKKKLSCRIENYGLCGRCIPHTESQIRSVCEQMAQWQNREAPVWIWIMLGTNDLLMGSETTAANVAVRMKHFLEAIINATAASERSRNLLLIAPPKMKRGAWVEEERLVIESQKLGEEYRKVAETLGIRFADAGKWEIPLAFDGVHFLEEGHRIFAGKMEEYLQE